MKKITALPIALCALLVFSTLACFIQFGSVEASVDVNGILYSDAIWTKVNSPYNLLGPVAVTKGVVLTVEPGVTVNLNGHYLQVNGTLTARGADADKIQFNDGDIIFTPVSNGWNESANSGSIIENTVVKGSISISTSVKITHNTLNGLSVGGSATISYNSIDSISISGSPLISNNEITGDFTIAGGSPTITANILDGRPWARRGEPVFSGNKISDGINCDSAGGQVTITNNELSSSGNYAIISVIGIHADISGNKIIGTNNSPTGISVGGILSSATITQNQIYGCATGISLSQTIAQVTKNVITDNDIGLKVIFGPPMTIATPPYSNNASAVIEENTIANNSIGIQYTPYELTSTVTNNNIQDNSQYNFKLQYPTNVSIPNNWWGTTDASKINQTIFDSKNDFNIGKVNFIPFLNEPVTITNQTSTPSPLPTNSPTPTVSPVTTPTATVTPIQLPSPSLTLSPSQNPTESPTTPQTGLNEIEIAILVVLVIIAVLLAGILAFLIRKKR